MQMIKWSQYFTHLSPQSVEISEISSKFPTRHLGEVCPCPATPGRSRRVGTWKGHRTGEGLVPVFPKGWLITRLLGMLDLKHSSFGNVQLLHSFVLKMGLHQPQFWMTLIYIPCGYKSSFHSKTTRYSNGDFDVWRSLEVAILFHCSPIFTDRWPPNWRST